MPKEEVIGIPSRGTSHDVPKVSKPTIWELGVHDHEAKKRGRHFDLRLGDPKTGHAHSWALPPKLPAPGESVWAIKQPTHTVKYMDFQGEIPEGYGAGKVKLPVREKAEVLYAAPDHVSFNRYTSSGPEHFALHRVAGERMWKLFNNTPTREDFKLPSGKPKYKEMKPHAVPFEDERYVFSAKIDDAHNLFVLPKASKGHVDTVRVVSYREGKKTPTNLIEHTPKIKSLFNKPVPKGLEDTIVRGGVFAIHPETGRAVDAHILGGMLNSNVWKSREDQKKHGQLKAVIYDVERFKGKDVSQAPYAEKLEILKRLHQALPELHLPTMAFSAKAKKKLIDDIKQGLHPETKEGVVLWNLVEGKPAIKAKFKDEHDVYIRGFFPGEGKYRGRGVGGFVYSHNPSGPIVGRVGTGLSDKQRLDMHSDPGKYAGAVAVVEAMEKYGKTEALRAPAFKYFHLDKNPPEVLDRLKLK